MRMLNREKIHHCLELLKENYVQNSVITRVVEVIDYDENQHRDLDFLKLGIWTYVPKEWFLRTDVFPDLVFIEFGRGIAIGEEKYLIEQILNTKEVKQKMLAGVNYQNVVEAIKEMGIFSDLVIFAPINHFVRMHVDWMKEAGAMVVVGNELIVEANRIPLFWSSKYVDFNDFIIVRRSFGRWIVKPSISERLSVQIVESSKRRDKMELKAQTVFHFDIIDPSRILILKPQQTE